MKIKQFKMILIGLLLISSSSLFAQGQMLLGRDHGNDDGIPPDDQLRVTTNLDKGKVSSTLEVVLGRDHGNAEGIPPDNLLRNLNNTTIFPNPVQEVAYLQTPSTGLYTVIVYTISGQEMINASFEGNQYALPLEHLDAGMYWLRIYDVQKNSIVRKIIKQ